MKSAELAILGLILERPRHGYQIEQLIEERNMREWTAIGFSSIYYILARLEQQGCLTARWERPEGRGPARKVYRITEAGVAAWHQATLQVLSTPKAGGLPFLLGMAGLPAIEKEEAVRALREYQQHLARRVDRVEARWREAGESLPLFLEGMFEYSIRLAQAEFDWLDGFIPKLEVSRSSR